MIPELRPDERRRVLDIAATAIGIALTRAELVLPPADELTGALARPGVSFVTLEREGALLGCVGALEPSRPLGLDVAEHAVAAALADPRLPAIDADDYATMAIEVSVLGPLDPIDAAALDVLHAALRPGRDGLVIGVGAHQATFLPAVWRHIPNPAEFCEALWQKAGLEPRTWPAGLRASRYETLELADPGPRAPLTTAAAPHLPRPYSR